MRLLCFLIVLLVRKMRDENTIKIKKMISLILIVKNKKKSLKKIKRNF
jgi:hypothetical protein